MSLLKESVSQLHMLQSAAVFVCLIFNMVKKFNKNKREKLKLILVGEFFFACGAFCTFQHNLTNSAFLSSFSLQTSWNGPWLYFSEHSVIQGFLHLKILFIKENKSCSDRECIPLCREWTPLCVRSKVVSFLQQNSGLKSNCQVEKGFQFCRKAELILCNKIESIMQT